MSQLLILLKSKQALDSKIPDSQDFGVFLPPFSQNWFKGFQGPVRTNAFPKVCVFVVIEKASINSRPHYRFDALSTVHTKTFENDRIARCEVRFTLCACCRHTRLRYFRSSFSFRRVFDCPDEYDMCAFSFWSTFNSVFKSMRFFYENARRISVDGTPKRVEMYAFWNKNALVWKAEDCWFLPLLAINVFNSVLFLLPVPPEASSTLHAAFFWLKAWRHRLLCHGVFFSDSRARPSRPWSSLWQLFRASAKDQLDA